MHDERHHLGLASDLAALSERSFNRRALLRIGLGAGLASLLGCDKNDSTPNDENTSAGSSGGEAGSNGAKAGSSGSGSCSKIPEETAGPYPGDGSNGQNALVLSGIVRKDIRSSFAGASGTAEGVPLTVKLKVVDVADGCTPLAGYAVYLWHCDRAGLYSLYSPGVTEQNYLRGVQETDEDGAVEFTTIFPACYSGRWPHIHFEVYQSLDAATDSNNKVATSQLALPEDACDEVFAETGYEQSVSNMQRISLTSDMVFSDGAEQQLAATSGDVAGGYETALTIPISA